MVFDTWPTVLAQRLCATTNEARRWKKRTRL